ncbi:MAG: hypothetical protein AB8B95_14730 [Pseudohongiellaceae bacterium]
MTEYEAISIFNEIFSNLVQVLFGYISILSAFLVMSYFAADRLNRVLATIVVALFTLSSVMLVIQVNFLRTDLSNVYEVILNIQSSNPDGNVWFGNVPLWTVQIQSVVQNLITIGGYFGCIAFFYYQKATSSSEGGT